MEHHELDPPVDDSLIDRIVDGGMTPEELRAATQRLERDPDGWKRCAVAFLEAQVLNESLRALGQTGKQESGQSLPLHRAAGKRARHRWLRPVAAAAMVGASFASGWMAHGTRTRSPAQDSLVRDSGMAQLPPMSVISVSKTASPPSDAPPEDRALLPPGDPNRMIRAVGTIRFGPESSPAEVPVLAGPGITQDWLVQQPPPVSQHGQAVLAREGYQVQQLRRYLTTVLADGRRVAIPVDHVRIQYTGNEPL